jgi:hypothetical protein
MFRNSSGRTESTLQAPTLPSPKRKLQLRREHLRPLTFAGDDVALLKQVAGGHSTTRPPD